MNLITQKDAGCQWFLIDWTDRTMVGGPETHIWWSRKTYGIDWYDWDRRYNWLLDVILIAPDTWGDTTGALLNAPESI